MESKTSPSSGFTLLELVIVLGILASLAVLSVQSISTATANRKKIQLEVDFSSTGRDALKIMERDINLAFHYRDLEKELIEAASKAQTAPSVTSTTQVGQTTTTTNPFSNPGGNNPPPNPFRLNTQNRLDPETHFVGTETELSFATLNASTIDGGQPLADFFVVGYSVRDCRRPGQDSIRSSTKCLLRRTKAFAEGDVTKGGEEIVLLDQILEFKFRYFGEGKQDWVTEWNSLTGDSATKSRYPEAVEISLTIGDPANEKQKKISFQIVAPIRFPNNFDPTSQSGAPAGGAPQGNPPQGNPPPQNPPGQRF